ncbi:MAG TPA: Yip1 family protein [Gemmatimonadales bacterium]|nr:Yip1 family protein [Gemmatimonadales bacterium]
MGAGIQQPPLQQGGGGSALADVVKVLFEPTAVFERVRERPRFLVPFLAICALQIVIYFVNLPYLKVAMQAQMAAAHAPAGATDPSKFAAIGALFIPIGIAIAFVLAAFILWVLVSLVGGEGKFGTLLSVATYASVPAVVVLAIVGTIVLHLQGTGQITSPQDMQPALGLDLLVPSAKGFLGAALKAINPFGIWGLVLTAIGVSTTHRLSKGSGYLVATISFLIGVCIAGLFAGLFGSRAG